MPGGDEFVTAIEAYIVDELVLEPFRALLVSRIHGKRMKGSALVMNVVFWHNILLLRVFKSKYFPWNGVRHLRLEKKIICK